MVRSAKAAPITVERGDVGRRVSYTGGLVAEDGVIAKWIDDPGFAMVSFGGCAPERVETAKLRWKGRK